MLGTLPAVVHPAPDTALMFAFGAGISAGACVEPQACQTCHTGFDHPQWEMYSSSKHGGE